MDKQRKIDEILSSFDGMEQAEPKPFLLTRVNAAMQNENSKQESFWYKIASNLSRPVVATVAIFIFILLNGYIFYNNFSTGKTVNEIVKDTNVQSSEFAVNVAGAFDLDGIEQ